MSPCDVLNTMSPPSSYEMVGGSLRLGSVSILIVPLQLTTSSMVNNVGSYETFVFVLTTTVFLEHTPILSTFDW